MQRTTRIRSSAVAGVVALGLIVAVAPAGAQADGTEARTGGPHDVVEAKAAEAMAAQQGIPVREATRRLGRQRAQGEQAARLERSLGALRSGGSYIDPDNGELVVTTTDPSADTTVTRGAARVRRVDDSTARLELIMAALDQQAKTGGAGGVQRWGIDVPSNTVTVTVTDGANDPATRAMIEVAARFGSSVAVTAAPADQAPQGAAEYLAGGMEIVTPSGGTCSVGFNAFDSANRPVFLTAGHCVPRGGWVSRKGLWLGSTRTVNFPGDDFATIWNQYPSYWITTASVFNYRAGYVTVKGSWDAPVGATVCKSGRTTGWTCGVIQAKNETVSYNGGTVYGLTRHNACVEGGDSGGANISTGGFALGLTAAASMHATTKLCMSKYGAQNVSWFQPIGEALTRNGLRLAKA